MVGADKYYTSDLVRLDKPHDGSCSTAMAHHYILLANFDLLLHKLVPDMFVRVEWVGEVAQNSSPWEQLLAGARVSGAGKGVHNGGIPHSHVDVVDSVARNENDARHGGCLEVSGRKRVGL